jgi:hypothetical protein
MAFEPAAYSLGEHVVTNQELSNASGTFPAGHRFQLIDVHYKGGEAYYDLRDRDLNLLGGVPAGCFERAPALSSD